MQVAVISTGGKQYLVMRNTRIKIEKIPFPEGADFDFPSVCLLVYGGNVKVGTPHVASAKVSAKVISHGLHDKVISFKFKPKKRERRKKGHRQAYTLVEITDIKDSGTVSAEEGELKEKKPPPVRRRVVRKRDSAAPF